MVIEIPEPGAAHPLVSLVGDLEHALDEAAGAPAWTMTPGDLSEVLPRLARAQNRLAAAQLRMLREADRHQVGDAVGAANTAGWWANSTRTTKPAAHRQVALAARLDDDAHVSTSDALAAGVISVEQASVIVDAVEALPDELVTPSLRRDAERHLVTLAAHHDPKDLRMLGRKVLDVLAPEISEEHERRVLENQEQHAAATAMFTMRPDGHGSMLGRFKIPELAGAMLAKHLNALAAPKHRASAQRTEPTRPKRLGGAKRRRTAWAGSASHARGTELQGCRSPNSVSPPFRPKAHTTIRASSSGCAVDPNSLRTPPGRYLLHGASHRTRPWRVRRHGTSRPPPLRSSGAFVPGRLHLRKRRYPACATPITAPPGATAVERT